MTNSVEGYALLKETAEHGYPINIEMGRANFERRLGTTDFHNQVKAGYQNSAALQLKDHESPANRTFDWMLGL